jgi:hypothetical protein
MLEATTHSANECESGILSLKDMEVETRKAIIGDWKVGEKG